MTEFIQKFITIIGQGATVLLEHCFFDRQTYYCDALHIINDNQRIGLILKKQPIFMYKQDVIFTQAHENTLVIADDKLRMTIIVNKL